MKIKNINQLVGLFIDGNTQSNALTNSQLQAIATEFGYRTAQVRDNQSMYDCMYDPARLQVHVNERSQITLVQAG